MRSQSGELHGVPNGECSERVTSVKETNQVGPEFGAVGTAEERRIDSVYPRVFGGFSFLRGFEREHLQGAKHLQLSSKHGGPRAGAGGHD